MKALLLATALLAGCAATPQEMSAQSSYDVCRLTMGGPHARVAEYEARRRGLDCRQYYGAIAAQEQARAAAMNQAIQYFAPRPAPQTINCDSYRFGNGISTTCR